MKLLLLKSALLNCLVAYLLICLIVQSSKIKDQLWFQVSRFKIQDSRFKVQGSNVFKALVGLRVIVANGVFGLVELVGYIARGKDDLIVII